MRNIKLTIEYDGKDFNGWQKQQARTKDKHLNFFVINFSSIYLLPKLSFNTMQIVHSKFIIHFITKN